MDIRQLRKLIDLMNVNDLVEVEIESEGSKVRLKKATPQAPAVEYVTPMPMGIVPTAPAAPATPTAPAADGAPDVEGDSVTFNSPMVGTFYTAPGPGADIFVNVGDKVTAKSVLCIIEAMKVMNEINADMEGEVLEILVNNGEAVEYNQPLFTIRPN